MTSQSFPQSSLHEPRLASRKFIILMVALGLGLAGWMPTNSFLSVFVRDQFGESVLSAAVIVMGIHLGGATFGLTAGIWIRRFGSKSAFIVGFAGQLGFLAALGLFPEILWVIPLSPIAGTFLAYHWSGMQSYLIEVAPESRRGVASGIGSLVVVLSPGISGLFLSQLALRGGFHTFLLAAFCLVSGALILGLFALPQSSHSRKAIPASRKRVLGRSTTSVPRLATEKESIVRSFTRLIRERTMGLSLVVRIASALSFGVFNLLAGPKLVDAGGGFESLGLFVFGGAVAGGFAQVLVGSMSDRFGRRRLLTGAAFIAIGASITFGLAASIPILLVASSLHWFAQSAFQTLLVALIGDVVTPTDLGKAMTLQTSGFSLGMFAGALVAGLLSAESPGLAFTVTAICLSLGLVASLAIPTIGGLRVQATATGVEG